MENIITERPIHSENCLVSFSFLFLTPLTFSPQKACL